MIDRLAASLPVTPSDGSGPVTAKRIRQDIQAIAKDWAARGIDVGSPAALRIDL